MSIESTQPTLPVNGLTTSQEMRPRSAAQESPAPVRAEKGSEVTLSALTRQIQTDDSRDVDHARVAEIRAALAAGELPLEPEKIARSLVQDMFQFHN